MFDRILRIFASTTFLIVILPFSYCFAQSAPEDERAVTLIEEWIESIETLSSRFVQVAPDGSITRGDFYLRRPGLMRFQYDPPSPLLVVSDGFSLHLYDRELDEATSWPIFTTPLRPLLLEDIDIAGTYDFLIVRSPKILRITLIDPEDPDQGSLTLVFHEDPFELYQWVVIDSVGLTTVVVLSEVLLDSPLTGQLFTFDDPRTREENRP